MNDDFDEIKMYGISRETEEMSELSLILQGDLMNFINERQKNLKNAKQAYFSTEEIGVVWLASLKTIINYYRIISTKMDCHERHKTAFFLKRIFSRAINAVFYENEEYCEENKKPNLS